MYVHIQFSRDSPTSGHSKYLTILYMGTLKSLPYSTPIENEQKFNNTFIMLVNPFATTPRPSKEYECP
jgi:hypothetical protein